MHRWLKMLVLSCGLLLSACQEGSGGTVNIGDGDVELDCDSTVDIDGDGSDDIWESAPWPPTATTTVCSWFRYEGRTRYTIEHDLPSTPTSVLIYIAFAPDGLGASIAAGDTGRIREITDTDITIENGTNQDFYVRIVAQ